MEEGDRGKGSYIYGMPNVAYFDGKIILHVKLAHNLMSDWRFNYH